MRHQASRGLPTTIAFIVVFQKYAKKLIKLLIKNVNIKNVNPRDKKKKNHKQHRIPVLISMADGSLNRIIEWFRGRWMTSGSPIFRLHSIADSDSIG